MGLSIMKSASIRLLAPSDNLFDIAEWFPLPQHLTEPHPGHEAHLCMAENVGFVKNNLEEYKKYVRNPQFICKQCGRAAASADNLCHPDTL